MLTSRFLPRMGPAATPGQPASNTVANGPPQIRDNRRPLRMTSPRLGLILLLAAACATPRTAVPVGPTQATGRSTTVCLEERGVDPQHIDPLDPRHREALAACGELPLGGDDQGTARAVLERYAECMRDQGLVSFPDPGPEGGFDPTQIPYAHPGFPLWSAVCFELATSPSLAFDENRLSG